MPVTSRLSLAAKGDQSKEDLGLKRTDKWRLSTGVRNDLLEDQTQQQGQRSDAVAQVAFDPGTSWRAYGFVQDTISADDGRENNGRIGAGGSYRVAKRFK